MKYKFNGPKGRAAQLNVMKVVTQKPKNNTTQ